MNIILQGRTRLSHDEFATYVKGVIWPCNDETTIWLISTRKITIGKNAAKFILSPSVINGDGKVTEWYVTSLKKIPVKFESLFFKKIFPQCCSIQRFMECNFVHDTVIQIDCGRYPLPLFKKPIYEKNTLSKQQPLRSWKIDFINDETEIDKISMVLYYHTNWIVFSEDDRCFIIQKNTI